MTPGAKTLTVEPETSCSRPSLWVRTAGGPAIGFGHLRRCFTLAGCLRDCCTPLFLLDRDDEWTLEQVINSGWDFDAGGLQNVWSRMPVPAAILIDTRLTEGVGELMDSAGSRGIPVISIHDLGLAPLPSDIAVDGSIVPNRQEAFVRNRRKYCGTDYMVLDPAYGRLHQEYKGIRETVHSVFINLGGGNSGKYFSVVLEGLEKCGHQMNVTGVSGFVSWGLDSLCRRDWGPLRFCWEDRNIEQALFQSDLAITAGGLSAYEALCAGTPLAALSYDSLQQSTICALASEGACIDLGAGDRLDPLRISEMICSLDPDIEKRRSLSARGREIIDGRGAERVARIIRQEICRSFSAMHGRSDVSSACL
jgi:UDP-2,4-diacetamido-2,4,6-trideoxy-beta-L-altropyranose hydrolase